MVAQDPLRKYNLIYAFIFWFPLKFQSHILNKPQLKAEGFFKYMWTFSAYHVLKGKYTGE